MNIAIGIITKNRSKKLYRLLFLLAPQLKNNHKIFILENGSNIVEQKKIRKLKIKNFNLIKKAVGNIPKSRNFLLKKVKNKFDILLFIDDDCIVSKNWLEEYENIFKDKKIDVVQGSITSIPSDNMFAKISDLLFTLWFSKNTTGNITKIIDTKNVGLRLKSLNSTLFSENIEFATDIDLAVKLNKKNIIVKYFNSPLVFHEEQISLKKFIKHRIRLSFAYRNINNKYKNYFKSTKIIKKNIYLWKNLNLNFSKKLYVLFILTLSYGLVLLKSIPKFSCHSKP